MSDRQGALLVVDDSDSVRNMLVRRLQRNGYDVTAACAGSEALDLIACRSFDLILLDYMMPGMDGLEVVKQLRQDSSPSSLAVIMVTARDESDKIVEALALGADDYVTKPVDFPVLLARIEVQLARKRAEAALEEARNSLEVANADLESFSFSVSHDLRAPLRAITGFSQALIEDCADRLTDEGRDHLDRICTASRKMGRLIDDLLAFSRNSRGALEHRPVNLSRIACDVVETLRERDPGRVVDFELAPDVRGTGDARLLRVVLENLLGNAWKYSREEARAKVEFGTRSEDGETVYYVRDNGVGFDMAHADCLFQPFQRLHSESEFEGTGIGLATVARIVRRHGGRVWAEARLAHGTTMSFTLAVQHPASVQTQDALGAASDDSGSLTDTAV